MRHSQDDGLSPMLARMATLGEVMTKDVLSVAPEDTIGEAAQKMTDQGVGAVVVSDFGRLIGIFTERDALLRVVDRPETWSASIDTVMTREPNTVQPTDSVVAALRLMNRGHYRNVPVVSADGSIVGNLTHYAILKFFSDRFQQEIYNLPPDPDQLAKAPEGA